MDIKKLIIGSLVIIPENCPAIYFRSKQNKETIEIQHHADTIEQILSAQSVQVSHIGTNVTLVDPQYLEGFKLSDSALNLLNFQACSYNVQGRYFDDSFSFNATAYVVKNGSDYYYVTNSQRLILIKFVHELQFLFNDEYGGNLNPSNGDFTILLKNQI